MGRRPTHRYTPAQHHRPLKQVGMAKGTHAHEPNVAMTDYGVLTILGQDDVGGLEVLTKDGQWIAAPPIPGTFVVNIGDMLETWTCGTHSTHARHAPRTAHTGTLTHTPLQLSRIVQGDAASSEEQQRRGSALGAVLLRPQLQVPRVAA